MSADRQASEVIAEFATAADRLTAMAKDWVEGQFRHNDVADADSILRGLTHLLNELRQRSGQ
ncbi:MAG TPA: hypothetical protein VFJ87_04875 [Rhodanobacteraceae bacterium]|nr:hypothetical protein [Rhodanobacteraceae bacterium]